MSSFDTPPLLHQVALDPAHDLPAQPFYIDAWVVASGVLALSVRRAGYINDVYQCVGVAEVVEELVAQAFAFVGAGDEASYI
jgi:hypothetical protein